MNIAMITQEYPPYLLGGIATHVQELSKGLVAAGHNVDVFSYGMERTFTIEDHGARVHFIQFPFKNRKDQYDGGLEDVERAGHKLAEHAKSAFWNRPAPEIIHAHEWLTFGPADRLRTCFNVPAVVTLHMLWATLFETVVRHPQADGIVRHEQICCQRSDRIIAVSRTIRDEVMARFNVESSRVDVVWNGFDPAFFDPALISPESVEAEKKRLGPAGNRLIVYAGRLSPQKGLSGLLLSAQQVLQCREDVSYVIAGKLDPGGYSDVLTAMVRSQPILKNKVHFLDRVSRERLAVLYKLATLVVVPSVYEPFGYAAVEPMAAGKPVVASDTGGLAEIIEGEQSGLLVPLTRANGSGGCDVNVRKLAQAQIRILDDPLLARRLGENAQVRVRSMFGPGQMTEGTLRTYSSLVTPGQGP